MCENLVKNMINNMEGGRNGGGGEYGEGRRMVKYEDVMVI